MNHRAEIVMLDEEISQLESRLINLIIRRVRKEVILRINHILPNELPEEKARRDKEAPTKDETKPQAN